MIISYNLIRDQNVVDYGTLTARFNKIRSSGSTCKTVDKGSSKMIVTTPYVVPSKVSRKRLS